MPRHDYQCARCHDLLRDVVRTIDEGARAHPPICARCAQPMEWLPNVGFIDAKEPFQRFSTFDGRNRPVEIDSLRKLRQVERESEQQARNGEGQPMVWRHYSQDRSNRDRGVFGEAAQARPDPAFLRKITPGVCRTPDDVAYGPGVGDANTSALPESEP